MARTSSFILMAAIAIALFSAEPADGQFPIPKIKIPKIVKTQPTTSGDQGGSTTVNADPVTSTSANSSSSQSGSTGRGVPISGARITFSNNPDGSNPKTTFTSAENIYVQSVTWNGVSLDKPELLHGDLMKGGTLHFEMGPSPGPFGVTTP